MDHVSAGEARRDGAETRRNRMREQARAQRTTRASTYERYLTPEWLERSFVLPLTAPEASDLPSQPAPSHDAAADADADDTLPSEMPPRAGLVRTPSEDIDFARVVRRADLSRQVTRLHWTATGLTGLALLLHLLVGSTVALGAVVAFALVTLVTFAVRVKLDRRPGFPPSALTDHKPD